MTQLDRIEKKIDLLMEINTVMPFFVICPPEIFYQNKHLEKIENILNKYDKLNEQNETKTDNNDSTSNIESEIS